MTDKLACITDWTEETTIEPGNTAVVRGMPADKYHAHPAMSQSRLKDWCVSALDGLNPSTPDEETSTPLMRGSAVHCLLLDGEEVFNSTYYTGGPVNPKTGTTYGRGTKKFQEWLAEQGDPDGKKYLTETEMAEVHGMAQAVVADGFSHDLITMPGCERELSLFWTETVLGETIPCKARLDWWHPEVGLVDAKSTDDPEDAAFARSIANRGWHIQAFWYPRGVVQTGLQDTTPQYGWVAMQSRPPFKVKPHRPHPYTIACGRAMAYRGLVNHAQYLKDGEARQQSTGFNLVKLPSFAWPDEDDINDSERVLA